MLRLAVVAKTWMHVETDREVERHAWTGRHAGWNEETGRQAETGMQGVRYELTVRQAETGKLADIECEAGRQAGKQESMQSL
jgi:hypothetical protein